MLKINNLFSGLMPYNHYNEKMKQAWILAVTVIVLTEQATWMLWKAARSE